MAVISLHDFSSFLNRQFRWFFPIEQHFKQHIFYAVRLRLRAFCRRLVQGTPAEPVAEPLRRVNRREMPPVHAQVRHAAGRRRRARVHLCYGDSAPHRHFQITEILLKNIAQSLPQYLFWKDRRSVYLGCNQRFAELVGLHSVDEIIGKTDFDLPWQATGHTADFFQQTDQAAMHGHPVDRQEECLRLPDGRQIITLVSKLPIKDERQHVLGVVGYFSDITELKEKEQALQTAKQQAEAANRAKSLFIAKRRAI
jgi:PAS domain S-box-containing protein